MTSDSVDRSANQRRDLANFHVGAHSAGRTLLWQIAWFVAQNILFDRWWYPSRLRPPLLRAFGARVGQGCLIRHGVRVHWPWNLTLGDQVWIGEFAWIHSLVPVVIEGDVCVSQQAALVTGSHDPRDPHFAYDNGPIRLLSGSWVGTRAMVLRGVTVGHGAVVSANVVASEDIPDNTVLHSARAVSKALRPAEG